MVAWLQIPAIRVWQIICLWWSSLDKKPIRFLTYIFSLKTDMFVAYSEVYEQVQNSTESCSTLNIGSQTHLEGLGKVGNIWQWQTQLNSCVKCHK